MAHRLDERDRAILDLVQRDNRLTSDAIGERVGLGATAVQLAQAPARRRGDRGRRRDRLAKAVGRGLMMMVMVSLERERADIIDRFKRSLRATPEVMNGYSATGEADFVLVVSATDMEDYEAFTRRFFYGNPDIKNFKTMVVMDRVKIGFALPLGEPDDGAS